MIHKIQLAQRTDLPEILQLQKECYLSEAELYNDFTIPPLLQTIESMNEEFDSNWLFLKITYKDEIIATGRGITEGDTTHIAKLAVKKGFQNQKLGQALLHEIEARLNNCSRYELFTGYKSERNIHLYKKNGYAAFKTEFIHDNLSLVFMEKFR